MKVYMYVRTYVYIRKYVCIKDRLRARAFKYLHQSMKTDFFFKAEIGEIVISKKNKIRKEKKDPIKCCE